MFKLDLGEVDLTAGEYTMLIRPLWDPNTSDEDKDLSIKFSGNVKLNISEFDHSDGKKLFQKALLAKMSESFEESKSAR